MEAALGGHMNEETAETEKLSGAQYTYWQPRFLIVRFPVGSLILEADYIWVRAMGNTSKASDDTVDNKRPDNSTRLLSGYLFNGLINGALYFYGIFLSRERNIVHWSMNVIFSLSSSCSSCLMTSLPSFLIAVKMLIFVFLLLCVHWLLLFLTA